MSKKGTAAVPAAHNKPCTIRACTCRSTYQDRLYGTGMRVHNPSNKGPRCTVCAVIKSVAA